MCYRSMHFGVHEESNVGMTDLHGVSTVRKLKFNSARDFVYPWTWLRWEIQVDAFLFEESQFGLAEGEGG